MGGDPACWPGACGPHRQRYETLSWASALGTVLDCVGAEACAWVPELGTCVMHRGPLVCHGWQAGVAGDSQNLCLCVLFH